MSNRPVLADDLEKLIDKGGIEVAMTNGNWWTIRRAGRTKRWVRDHDRIRIPFKMGLRGTGQITETDFVTKDGAKVLQPARFRVKEGY